MRLTKAEKEAVYRTVAIYSEQVEAGKSDFTPDEAEALESARKKMRMELYGF